MQTNNVFDAGRFGNYFKKHIIDNYRLYLMSMVVLAGVLVAFILFMVTVGDNQNTFRYSNGIPFYLIGMYIAGFIFTSLAFNELGNKGQSIDYLLLPASHLEKFLVTWVVTVIGFQIVYHIAFFLAIQIGLVILNMTTHIVVLNDTGQFTHNSHSGWYYFYFLWFILQSVFLLGAAYFHKYSYIKTMFLIFLFLFSMYMINALFVNTLFHQAMERWTEGFPFVGTRVRVGTPGNYDFIMLPKSMQNVLLFTGKYLLAPIIWTLAYFRLKDQEA